MKTKMILTTVLFLITVSGLKAQVINSTFGSVRGWTGTCKIIVVDSTTEGVTEYSFEGPAELRNELDMSPYNTNWPNPAMNQPSMNNASYEEMMNASKAQEDKFRVWNARVKVRKQMNYDDVVSSAHYTCTLEKTEMLKFQIVIIDNTVTIVPDLVFSDVLNCSGTRDGVAVLPQEDHRMMLGNFKITANAPTGGGMRLQGKKTMTDDSQRMTAEWDFSPMQ